MIDFNKIELIALDLDETTLNDRGRLTDRTKTAIESAIAEGIHIVIASGRAYSALPGEVLNIKGIEYAITSNGAAIYRVRDGKCMHSVKILESSVKKILELKNSFNITYEAFINGVAYADSAYIANPTRFGVTEKAKHYLQTTRNPIEDMPSFMEKHSKELDSIDIVVPDVETRNKISALLSAADRDIYVTSSVKYLVEAAHREAGKGKALRRLCSFLGIELISCAAFGNADNDIDMLKECGFSAAVANGTENCLSCADIIAPSHNEDGVAQIIEEILNCKNHFRL